jgi:N-hydroxyarylamine O-acetyltransferase
MTSELNLDAYLARIRWTAPVRPDLETLAGLISAHIATIPFENFNVLLGRPIRIDLASLQDKLVVQQRGGYCFEHATLFAAVLTAIGFSPTTHASRVTVFKPFGQQPRTHMFLTVTLNGETYAVDPGFGPFGCPAPIPFNGSMAPAAKPTHRLVRDGDLWVLQAQRDGAFVNAWVSDMAVEHASDFEMANHFVCSHPSSVFTTSIMASAVTPTGRVSIKDRNVTRIGPDGASTEELPDRAALRALLAEHYGFDLPEIETMKVAAIPEWN